MALKSGALRWRLALHVSEDPRQGARVITEIGKLSGAYHQQPGEVLVGSEIVQYWLRVHAQQRELNRAATGESLPSGRVGIQQNSRVANDHPRVSRSRVN